MSWKTYQTNIRYAANKLKRIQIYLKSSKNSNRAQNFLKRYRRGTSIFYPTTYTGLPGFLCFNTGNLGLVQFKSCKSMSFTRSLVFRRNQPRVDFTRHACAFSLDHNHYFTCQIKHISHNNCHHSTPGVSHDQQYKQKRSQPNLQSLVIPDQCSNSFLQDQKDHSNINI